MQNARLDEAQNGIKIARRYISNLTYADDVTLKAESEEELKSLLMKVAQTIFLDFKITADGDYSHEIKRCLLLGREWASLVAQLVKNTSAMWETWVQSPGWEDPLEKGKATHSSILAWRIPRTI